MTQSVPHRVSNMVDVWLMGSLVFMNDVTAGFKVSNVGFS